MSIQDIAGMNVAEIIIHRGTNAASASRPFILYRNEQGTLETVRYRDYYLRSLEYGAMIGRMRAETGAKETERFHVGVFMQNIPEFFYILGGCAFTNSTLVGINNAQIGDKLAFDINTIDIKILFVDYVKHPGADGTFVDTVVHAKQTAGFTTLRDDCIIPVRTPSQAMQSLYRDIPAALQQYAGAVKEFAPVRLDETNAGVIIFTSGTTGVPKGIEVAWKKLVDVGITGTTILRYTEHDVGYICMPVNHSNSLYLNIMPALLNGAKLLLRRRFSVSSFASDIDEVGVTVWNCVGDPVQYLINSLKDAAGNPADYAHLPLRTVISTGTNAANRAAFTTMFGLEIFKEVYGSTESGAITAVDENTPEFSVGKLLKDIRVVNEITLEPMETAAVDATGRITNLSRAAGEIVVSQKSLGASAFTGYYKLPQETAGKICTINGEEFYRMGDLGAVMEKNSVHYLIFLGRTGDWIRYKGENWAPVDGEKIAAIYAGISNVGIIGVPQSIGKEDDPLYVLEVQDPAAFNVADFYAFCKEKLPHYMLPRFVRLVKKLPMTDTMKLKKTILKHDFYFRSPALDAHDDDIVYEIIMGKENRFSTKEYSETIAQCTDPTNQAALRAFTKRDDLF